MVDFDVVELGETDHPVEGETAPDFVRPLVNDEYWEDRSLSELVSEQPVLLVFHPMVGAFPATYLWNEFRDRGFDEYDVAVVGLSISTPYDYRRFLEDRELEDGDFRLFSDPANDVADRYDIVNDLDGMAGISEPRPAVFLVDEDRTIEYAWVATEWPEFPDYDEVESVIESHGE